jgi:hypothetical protein
MGGTLQFFFFNLDSPNATIVDLKQTSIFSEIVRPIDLGGKRDLYFLVTREPFANRMDRTWLK